MHLKSFEPIVPAHFKSHDSEHLSSTFAFLSDVTPTNSKGRSSSLLSVCAELERTHRNTHMPFSSDRRRTEINLRHLVQPETGRLPWRLMAQKQQLLSEMSPGAASKLGKSSLVEAQTTQESFGSLEAMSVQARATTRCSDSEMEVHWSVYLERRHRGSIVFSN